MLIAFFLWASWGYGVLVGAEELDAGGVAEASTKKIPAESPLENLDQEDKFQAWDYSWRGRMFALGVSDTTEESRVSGLQLSGGLKKKFSEYFDFATSLQARFETGTTHSLYEVNRVANGIWLDEAQANVHLVPHFVTLSAGAINQRYLQNPLLLTELSFPAVQEKFQWEGAGLSLGLVIQQAVPTSMSLSTRSVAKEKLPSFFTETFFANYNPQQSLWSINGRVGAFAFYDLPSSVAYDSRTQGNFAEGEFPENSSFRYGFRGLTYGGDLGLKLKNVQLKAGADALINQEAPQKYGRGLLTYVQAGVKGFGQWTLIPRAEYFRNERQSSPAFYNSADYGHNNRHGFAYELKAENLKLGVAFKAKYSDAQLIEEFPSQANTKIIMIYMDIFNGVN
ncbi:MAG: hypothetical protein K1X29_09335 [Bdellovibrionales bacterium]|nr:hypothetical protein [Bdellovibrionales bacterium]